MIFFIYFRRGVHSKFNLPLRNNNDDQASNQSNYLNQNKNNQPGNSTEIEGLKNIDQKLIEIIMSEVKLFIFEYIFFFVILILPDFL